MKKIILLLLGSLSPSILFSQSIQSTDVCIYGGTSSAVVAAVQVARMGMKVIIVSPDKHLGGSSSGGLGFTDTGNKEVIGGLSKDFYRRVYKHYQSPQAWTWQKQTEYGNKGQGTSAMDSTDKVMWIFEPHVAEQVFEDFIKENKITVYRNEWLNREKGVEKKDGSIISITTLSGKKFRAKMFIDATYEGDLMASSGVSFHVGREANRVYNEQWNGIETEVFQHGHYFKARIDPYVVPGNPSSGLLPLISAEPSGNKGDGDKRIQAYCYRMCLTTLPENKIAFTKPDGYDAKQYELLLRVFDSGWRETFAKFDPIPNRKTDTNNHGPFSTDYIGMNYAYPEATYEERRKILRQHEVYQKGWLYFIANDPRVPQDVKLEMQKWGLSKDEFKDNGNWPHQIYVREARRMIGEFVMTENELLGKSKVPKPIAMGSYTMDSHNAQRYVKDDGFVQNEGDVGVHTPIYQISYGSIVPKKEQCKNLLVPVCASTSHIAYGSIRMEPVFMVLGQSAATAAVMAIKNKSAVQDVRYEDLKAQLKKDKQVIE